MINNSVLLSELAAQQDLSCRFKSQGFTVEYSGDFTTKISDESGQLVADSTARHRHLSVAEAHALILGYIAGRAAATIAT